ncbi:hypothetical protein KAFR_0G03290 [Kazachstania africana CBS 2517]|uniref:Endoplasmic reticulum transmembrane protein n=1 Tax=Kazachstania africana (strain ATCC 22294 / BCRC 22015 / CBS 2517 / CECT 1963 / NBRC 1671 / NRRL Y-8276) TaxID=1071382 RepID=H2AYB1_KAZAF|nr:hypothetical protein KAFR_0G03290 [Kazachstania africana CBS 2517]CCF59361.1 hypothetical protein KAFR_0G03290 [Kazachstania africana CBS 2517]
MSLYYSLIFAILVFEVVLFAILALPIPTKYRKPITLVLIKPFQNSTIQISIKCILGFIALLFVDAINKVYNINLELNSELNPNSEKIEILSRKFLQQRNLYLTGITLFLTFVVMRTFGLVHELLRLKEIYRSDEPKKQINVKLTKDELLKEMELKDKEIKRLKEKAASLSNEL